ncbi:hypothetical protein BDK51DRAFT_51304 [Blyttiomyces helicus]|uniref:Uncharacterized protein n=1 Tax=Blyttiomyces helicus TaxID=388810 RepID=A0A4V1IQ19_9FUNG|nr:hypothetical protein BDK51DRAFT_51304 [Blyttiomyces helicus]|eukprot:RKO85017.1 hypothetical protein BDK51DRAFT_51304 [Blyttiomyces helicus]
MQERSHGIGCPMRASLSDLPRIDLAELRTQNSYPGRCLLVRTISEPVLEHSMRFAVKSESGLGIMLHIYRMLIQSVSMGLPTRAQLDAAFPIGTVFAIEDPSICTSARNGLPLLGVDTPTDVQDPRDWRALGNTEFRSGNLLAAYHAYTRGILARTDVPTLLTNRAQANLRLERFSVALDDANAALTLDGGLVKAKHGRAKTLHGMGRWQEAHDAFRALLDGGGDVRRGIALLSPRLAHTTSAHELRYAAGRDRLSSPGPAESRPCRQRSVRGAEYDDVLTLRSAWSERCSGYRRINAILPLNFCQPLPSLDSTTYTSNGPRPLALFSKGAIFNHPYDSNAICTCFGDVMVVRAATDIPTGAEGFLSYLPAGVTKNAAGESPPTPSSVRAAYVTPTGKTTRASGTSAPRSSRQCMKTSAGTRSIVTARLRSFARRSLVASSSSATSPRHTRPPEPLRDPTSPGRNSLADDRNDAMFVEFVNPP